MNTVNSVRLISILALNQWREQWRNKSFMIALFFAGILIYASILLGVLAVDQETRALLDFGQSFIELLGLGLAAYGAATVFLREMETKTIYLILSRPVPRWVYLLGRYFGLLLTTFGAVALMTAVHVSVLLWRGWHWQWVYFLGISGILLKLTLACALATFLALFTTSALSALTVTAILWALGNFIPEIAYLARKTAQPFGINVLGATSYIIPHLNLLNFRDRLDIPASILPSEPILGAVIYSCLYSAVCLILG